MRQTQAWWVKRLRQFLEHRKADLENDGRADGDNEFVRELDALIRDCRRYARFTKLEDVVDDVWIKLVGGQGLALYDPDDAKFETYIGVVVRNTCIDELRRLSRARRITDLDGVSDFLATPGPPFDRDLWRATRRAIESFPERDQKVLKDWSEGQKQEEIAAELGMTTGGIGNLLWKRYGQIRAEVDGAPPATPARRPRKPRTPPPLGGERSAHGAVSLDGGFGDAMEHLTPMQLATLLDGKASAEFERQAGVHFRECRDCWDEWLLGLSAQAAEAREQAQAGTSVFETSPDPRPLRSPRVLVLPLFPVVDEFDERAAAAGAKPPVLLPSLATEDLSIVVNFRESVASGLIRALLVARKMSIPERIGLSFPGAGLSFEFNQGVAELPGVTADQLRTARLELRLEELPDDPTPSTGV